MLILNTILIQIKMKNLKYHVGYIIHIFIRDKTVEIYKDYNIVVVSISWHFFFRKTVFSL